MSFALFMCLGFVSLFAPLAFTDFSDDYIIKFNKCRIEKKEKRNSFSMKKGGKI